jgi:hypothetical protein
MMPFENAPSKPIETPFPTTLVIAAATSAIVLCMGLLIYLKKCCKFDP